MTATLAVFDCLYDLSKLDRQTEQYKGALTYVQCTHAT
jgi:hypothetical protein